MIGSRLRTSTGVRGGLRGLRSWTLVLFSLIMAAASVVTASDDTPLLRDSPVIESVLVIPVRIHVLESSELPEANCVLSDEDLGRIISKLNMVWHQATIHFCVESVVREQAEGVARFKILRELSSGELPLGVYAEWLPRGSRTKGMLHVYYVHELPVNGVYLGDGVALVKETAALHPVPEGLDEPLPRVTAHELGHALDLIHVEDVTHLMASGTTGYRIAKDEVNRARRASPKWGVQRLDDLKRAAELSEVAGKKDQSRRLRGWIAEVEALAAAAAPEHPVQDPAPPAR